MIGQDESRLATFIAARPALLLPLQALAALGLPDAWIGAGFLRNPVWDALSGFPPGHNPPGDVDVVWFDPARASTGEDAAIEAALQARHPLPGPDWSVRNQARMAARNGDAPYRDTRDAVAHWPETATAIAARWTPEGVEVLAPHGLSDLFGRVVRPTPGFAERRPAAFAARLAAQDWTRRWPGVTITPMPDRSPP
ncbi:nucleotidyltransferase family protein [Belnapia sp. T6]|uniref:Nucleotidyltransferase family protein n=1 Tax=Belnapia mucosa TaxID=2804532 RepID=A0ABS1V9U7_9PROT|nr:nucleotidyltransferase family protein [Belnapia mucosa]MBL6458447.1 nucleotidyltransferase family protein [Belnapia mucosa]